MKFFKKIKSNLALANIFQLKYQISKKNIFFFFPFYHIGGAERVHIDILSVNGKNSNLCFITNTSKDTKFKEEFKKYSKLIYLGRLISRPSKKTTIRIIVNAINKKKRPIVFGCNSAFFYQLIPHLGPHVKVIDLIHAFADESFEVSSIPYLAHIDERIVLGKKTKKDFQNLYSKKNISDLEFNKIRIIRNKISPNHYSLDKPAPPPLSVLFVGRDSAEKRFHIVYEIAKKYQNSSTKFTCIGGFNQANYSDLKNLTFIDEIKDKNELNDYYQKAHVILITSSREGFPMVILEAMQFGVIPISTNVGEISEIVSKKNNTGFIIENTENENEIINNFISKIDCLNTNNHLLDTFSKKVIEVVNSEFSEVNFTTNYKSLFES